jgi:cell division protein FtsN
MARDYKHRATRKPARKPIPGWWWLITGIAVGCFVAFLASLDTQTASDNQVILKPAPKSQDVRTVKKAETKPLPSPPKPRFDFYTILPDMEVIIPEHEIEERRRLENTGKGKPGNYLIQIGSFRKLSEADRLKAQLALLGVESEIEKVTIKGAIWYRVKSGPYGNFRAVDKIRNRLHNNQIDSIVINLDA